MSTCRVLDLLYLWLLTISGELIETKVLFHCTEATTALARAQTIPIPFFVTEPAPISITNFTILGGLNEAATTIAYVLVDEFGGIFPCDQFFFLELTCVTLPCCDHQTRTLLPQYLPRMECRPQTLWLSTFYQIREQRTISAATLLWAHQ
jgi:hypothetical protein